MRLIFCTVLLFSMYTVTYSLPNYSLQHYEKIKNGVILSRIINSPDIFKKYKVTQIAQSLFNDVQAETKSKFGINDSSQNDSTKLPIEVQKILVQLNERMTEQIILRINKVLEKVAKDSGIGYIVDIKDSSLVYARNRDKEYYMPKEYFDGVLPNPGQKILHNPNIINLRSAG